ncbi:AraC family transcriptional regulator [Cohnella sp. CFH 77786]|uniref:helix-turn-helix transcriptional regulator n=1 Tax=Cohnella sp. CFH 77786 TaxID=2662265 RepID=UPI001C60EDD2|nr:AraC family transcriptional regulator [Cohnella sp. CFH 77786]
MTDIALFPVVSELDARLPVHLTTVGHWDHQDAMRRPDGFPHYQWLQIVSGEGELICGERRVTAKAGQGVCLYPRIPHRYAPIKSPWEIYWVSFDGGLAGQLLGQAGIAETGVYGTAEPELALSHLRNLLAAARSAPPTSAIEFSKILYAFLLDLQTIVHGQPVKTGVHRSRLDPVLRLIEERLHRPIGIAELAGAIGTSPQHLCTLFRKTLGMRPMAYVNLERIKRSKELMFRHPDLPIRDVAARVGMDNPSYFGAVFKKLEGRTPEQFKHMHGLR